MYFCPVTALKVFDLSVQIHSYPLHPSLCSGRLILDLPDREGEYSIGRLKESRAQDIRLHSWFLTHLVATSLYLQFLLKSLAPLEQSTPPLGSGYHSSLSSFQA